MSAERKPVDVSDSALRDCLAARSSFLLHMALELTERRAKDALVAELVEAACGIENELMEATDCIDVEAAMCSNGVSNARDRLSAALAALRGKDGASA